LGDIILREHAEEANDLMSIASTIGSLRQLSELQYPKIVELVSGIDAVFRDDPADIYAQSDFATRDRSRQVRYVDLGNSHDAPPDLSEPGTRLASLYGWEGRWGAALEVMSLMRRGLTAALVASALGVAGFVPAAGAESAYRVIVHSQVKGSQIPRATLSSIFLKQAPRWGDGQPVQPVDQSLRSRIRQSFVADVLQQPMVEVQIFWSRKMATG
jgi:hypothetical protein